MFIITEKGLSEQKNCYYHSKFYHVMLVTQRERLVHHFEVVTLQLLDLYLSLYHGIVPEISILVVVEGEVVPHLGH
jgi:hypothetical protein